METIGVTLTNLPVTRANIPVELSEAQNLKCLLHRVLTGAAAVTQVAARWPLRIVTESKL